MSVPWGAFCPTKPCSDRMVRRGSSLEIGCIPDGEERRNMRYLQDGQVMPLTSEKDLEEALSFYEENDKWYFPYANEIRVTGVDDLPLFYQDFQRKIYKTCPEDAFVECVRSSGIFLEVPGENILGTYAVRDIALESIFERAGLACRLMRTFADVGYVKALGAEKRGAILDMGFHQSNEPVKVLISDEKVNVIGSAKYAILDFREGIERSKAALLKQDDFDALAYDSGTISHEGLSLKYKLDGPGVDSHREAMKAMNFNAGDYFFMWSSSHTKISSMIGRLCMTDGNGYVIPIGKAVKIRHLGDPDKLMDAFAGGVSALGASLKENEDRIEALGNMVIYHPKTCLAKVFETCHCIAGTAKRREIDSMPDVAAMGMDIYLAVCRAAADATDVRAAVLGMEEAAQIQYMDLKAFDKE